MEDLSTLTMTAIASMEESDDEESSITCAGAIIKELLFVTAKMHIDRLNYFLTEAQALHNYVDFNIYSLVRDQTVHVNDIDTWGTQPPIAEFKTGFRGASVEELWRVLDAYREQEKPYRQNRRSHLQLSAMVILDARSEHEDTALFVYRAEDASETRLRVPFKFLPVVTYNLTGRGETRPYYRDPANVKSNGIVDIQKIQLASTGWWREGHGCGMQPCPGCALCDVDY